MVKVTDMDTKKPEFSLKGEIKKRRTQEIVRSFEARDVAKARGEPTLQALLGNDRSSSPGQPASLSPKRTSSTITLPVMPPPSPTTPQQTGPFSRTGTLPARSLRHVLRGRYALVGIAMTLVLVIAGAGLILSRANVRPVPTGLPVVRAADVVAYLKQVGVPVVRARELAVPNVNWKAAQEFQIDVASSGSTGTFIILSYASRQHAIPDIVSAQHNTTYRQWKLTTGSNLVLLTSPETDPTVGGQVQQQVLHYLLPTTEPADKSDHRTGQP
jgi:hypothetical protein